MIMSSSDLIDIVFEATVNNSLVQHNGNCNISSRTKTRNQRVYDVG